LAPNLVATAPPLFHQVNHAAQESKGIGHEDAPSADDAPSKVTKSSSVLMDDVTATHDGKTGRVHYFQIHFEMCLQQQYY
jgi:hypothetical protein